MLVLHGLGKWQKSSELAGTFPDPFGAGSATSLYLAIFAEVVCSALLVVGAATRLALVPLVITMAVAFFAVHGGALSGEHSGELAFIYMGGYLALLLCGPGRYSVDHLIQRRCCRDE